MVLLVYLVTCNGNKGQLYLDKFDISKRHLDKCILFCGAHYTLPEFKSYCSRKCKNGDSLSCTCITHCGIIT